jgi:PiT family inorganic phosphate transporter
MKRARLTVPQAVEQPKEERRRRKLVRRSHFLTIIAAWVITVPAAATISALIFWVIANYTGGAS